MKQADKTRKTATVDQTLLWNLLYDPNMTSPPHEIPREKNICSAAFRHTVKSAILFQSGMKRNLRPSTAPSKRTPFTSSAIRMK